MKDADRTAVLPSLGRIVLGKRPHIIAIVERPLSLQELDGLQSKGVFLLELRVDSFRLPFSQIIDFARLAQTKGFGLLGTLRLQSQSFEKNEKDEKALSAEQGTEGLGSRLRSFEEILPYVDAVDIEAETESKDKEALLALAHQKKRQILFSTHNFSYTPEVKQMQSILEEAQSYKADFVKLAYYAQDQEDLGRFFSFTFLYEAKRKEQAPHLIWIAMGPWGLLSRVLASFTGSLFSYAFIDQPNAPGQFSVEQLHQEFLRYHPAYCEYL